MSFNIKDSSKCKLFPIIYKTAGALILLRAVSSILPQSITSKMNIVPQRALGLTSRLISVIFTGSFKHSLEGLLESRIADLRSHIERIEIENTETLMDMEIGEDRLKTLETDLQRLREQKILAETALNKVKEETKKLSLSERTAGLLDFVAPRLFGAAAAEAAPRSESLGEIKQQFKETRSLSIVQQILSHPDDLFKNSEAFQSLKTHLQDLITAILRAHIEIQFAKEMPKKRPFLDERRARMQDLEHLLKNSQLEPILTGEGEEAGYLLIKEIHQQHILLTEEVVRLEREMLITQYRPSEDLIQMDPSRFQALYDECLRKDKMREALEKDLNKLIKRANLKEELNSLYGIKIAFIRKEADAFAISSAHPYNVGMGYSIFHLLCEAGIINEGKDWDGEQSFILKEEDLDKLKDYIGDLNRFFEDFSKSMRDFLSVEEPEEHINLAQKQIHEILNSAIRCTEEGRKKLSYLQCDFPCLLLGQVGLNLEGHPDRDFLRGQLTKIYRQEEMRSIGGKYKHFVRGTYQTNLSAENVQQIRARLNKFLNFKRYLMEKSPGTTLREAFDHSLAELGTESDLLKEYYVERLFGAFHPIVVAMRASHRGRLYHSELVEKEFRGRLEGYLKIKVPSIENEVAITPDNFQTLDVRKIRRVDDFERAYDNAIEIFLKESMAPYFKKQSPSYAPTEEEITALYGTLDKKDYGDTKGIFRDLKQLFTSLKQSKIVQAALAENPEIETQLDLLREAMEDRLTNKYPSLPPQGWPSSKERIKEAISHLEIYVASVVNETASRVSPESIKTSLVQIAGLDIEELKEGCDQGLNGRIQSLLIALSNDIGGGLDAYMIQKQKELLEAAFVKFINSGDVYDAAHSSHAPNYLAELRNYLGIARRQDETEATYAALSPDAKRMFKLFLEDYTPTYIYDNAKSFFDNLLLLQTLEIDNEENSDKMYKILSDLGFGQDENELDKKYRIQGNKENGWQYAFITEDLSKYLLHYLIQKEFFTFVQGLRREGHLYWQKVGEREEYYSP
jgi:hypothetical protein